jgi:hypothetical protein
LPQAVYVESPDPGMARLMPNTDGSLNVGNFPATQPVSGSVNVGNLPTVQPVSGSVNVGNLPTTQPVSGTVGINNFPPVQAVTGSVSVTAPIPAPGDVVSASRDTTGVMYTVPAGRMFKGSASLAACVAVAGVSQPSISTTSGTIHKITINGLALTSVASANTINDVYIWGGASGTAVTFTAGAAGTSTGQISGVLL